MSTTYVTGTITSLVADLADRRPQDIRTRGGVVVAIVAGALGDSILMSVATPLGAALPIVPALLGAVLLRRAGPSTRAVANQPSPEDVSP